MYTEIFKRTTKLELTIYNTPSSGMIKFFSKTLRHFQSGNRISLRKWGIGAAKSEFDSKGQPSYKENLSKAITGEELPESGADTPDELPVIRHRINLIMIALAIASSQILSHAEAGKAYKVGTLDIAFNYDGDKVTALGNGSIVHKVLEKYDVSSRSGMTAAVAIDCFDKFWLKTAEFIQMGYLVNTAVSKALMSTDAAWCKPADKAKAVNVSELVLKELKRLAEDGQITFASTKARSEDKNKPTKNVKKSCVKFNEGNCSNKSPCPDGVHRCEKCHQGGHGANRCTKK